MQERQLFEYAVIRIVPRVDREEFLNVGVVLYCSKQKFLQALYTLDQDRLTIFSKAIDLEEVEKYLVSFQKICHGGREGGPIGQLPIAERFRWLTAVRSTVVQTSPVHPGLCMDAEETIHNLFDRLVL